MTYKAVCFFDLDGTLLNGDHRVGDDVKEGIAQLKANNILPIIATGRGMTQLNTIREDSGIESVVSLNGAYVEVNGQLVYEEVIPTDVVTRFIDFTHSINADVSFMNNRKAWIEKSSDFIDEVYAAIRLQAPDELPGHYLDEKVHMLLALTDDTSLDAHYHQAFPELNFFRNSPRGIDVVLGDADKGKGVAQILNYLGHSDLPTYAFGDGPNDLALLKSVDYGIAMGNGVDAVKEIASFVTSANVDGGIIKGFKHFGLI